MQVTPRWTRSTAEVWKKDLFHYFTGKTGTYTAKLIPSQQGQKALGLFPGHISKTPGAGEILHKAVFYNLRASYLFPPPPPTRDPRPSEECFIGLLYHSVIFYRNSTSQDRQKTMWNFKQWIFLASPSCKVILSENNSKTSSFPLPVFWF